MLLGGTERIRSGSGGQAPMPAAVFRRCPMSGLGDGVDLRLGALSPCRVVGNGGSVPSGAGEFIRKGPSGSLRLHSRSVQPEPTE